MATRLPAAGAPVPEKVLGSVGEPRRPATDGATNQPGGRGHAHTGTPPGSEEAQRCRASSQDSRFQPRDVQAGRVELTWHALCLSAVFGSLSKLSHGPPPGKNNYHHQEHNDRTDP